MGSLEGFQLILVHVGLQNAAADWASGANCSPEVAGSFPGDPSLWQGCLQAMSTLKTGNTPF